jgi:hypothetical protein
MVNTKVSRVLNALSKGQELSAKQISSRFGLANPHDAIYKLREKGYSVDLYEYTDSRNKITYKYALNS